MSIGLRFCCRSWVCWHLLWPKLIGKLQIACVPAKGSALRMSDVLLDALLRLVTRRLSGGVVVTF
jgi:hypothetical protein